MMRSKEQRETKEVAEFLRLMADRMEKGQVVLQKGEKEAKIDVPEMIRFNVRAREKEIKKGLSQRITLSLSWMEGEDQGKKVVVG